MSLFKSFSPACKFHSYGRLSDGVKKGKNRMAPISAAVIPLLLLLIIIPSAKVSKAYLSQQTKDTIGNSYTMILTQAKLTELKEN